MKNNNEILSILEDEFVRLIREYNTFNRPKEYRELSEVQRLCELMEIPFEWEWEMATEHDIIRSITISGKRIEFD